MIKLLFISLTVILLNTVELISDTYIIKSSTGEFSIDNGMGWRKGTKTSELDEHSMIKLEPGSYVLLTDEDGIVYEINKSGRYSVQKIVSKNGSRQSSKVSKKFINYIMDELGEADDLLASENISENMGTLGSVERASLSKNSKLYLPTNSYVIDNIISFNWKSEENTKYTFYIKNEDDVTIYKVETENTFIIVDLSKVGIKPGYCYYWGVLYNEASSTEYCIQAMDNQNLSKLILEITQIQEEVDLNTSMGQLAIGYLYKNNLVTYKAMESFENAIDLSPSVSTFKVVYIKYLIELGMYDKADIMIENLINQ